MISGLYRKAGVRWLNHLRSLPQGGRALAYASVEMQTRDRACEFALQRVLLVVLFIVSSR